MSRYDWSRVRFASFGAVPWTPEEAAAFAFRVEQIAAEERERDVAPLRVVRGDEPGGAA